MQPGQLILDIACGNGSFSRRLAQLGAQVVACDFSQEFIRLAKARTTGHVDRIAYHVIDATDEAQLLALGRHRFDAAVCTMGIMDMPAIEALFNAVSQLLKANRPFVFSVMHPCFNSNLSTKVIEEEDRDGEIITTYAVKVTRYIHPFTVKGIGFRGQPITQYYFHRPISALFNAAFRAGFVLDGLEEPAFDGTTESRQPRGWANYTEIPPVFIARMRVTR